VILRGVAVVASVTLLLAGCQKSNAGNTEPADQKVLKVAAAARPLQLDPAVATDPGARALVPDLYQNLLTIPPGATIPEPDAADCQFDTPTSYRCTIRTGLTFSNGHVVDSSDVTFGIDRLRTVPGAARSAALFGTVKSVDAPRPDTVVFTLRHPDATLPYALTTPAAAIVDKQTFPADRALPPDGVVGSGPYKVGHYAATGAIVLQRFDKYKGTPRPQYTKVEISFPGDAAALTKAVRTGAADLAIGLPGGLKAPSGLQVVNVDAARIGYWAFRPSSATGRQPAVRRAVAQLLNRETLTRRVYGDRVKPLRSVLPDGYEGHIDAFTQTYGPSDRAKAAALLTAAGVRTPVRVTIGWTARQNGAREAEELRRQLEAGGLFEVTVRRSADADLVQQTHMADIPDADSFLSPVLRVNGSPSPTVSKLIEQEITAQSRSDRQAALTALQLQAATEAWVLPVWQDRSAVLAGPGISGTDQLLDRMSAVRYGYLRKD
jgi:peptide/nickel transport system substrate-binding protein